MPVPAGLQTEATRLFGVDVPVVQTGMGWVSDAGLTAATSAAGGLGILAGATMSFDELERAIDTVRARIDENFGVNMRADQEDVTDRIDLLADRGVRVASFALAPRPELIERCKQHGLVVVPSIGARRHAEKVAEWGADAVIVQGGEGGGHTGDVPTSILLPQVVEAVDIPVIAAGGFRDGRGLVAALAWGAAGIAMGTRFLLTTDSPVVDTAKRLYLDADVNGTVVTRRVDGVPQRVLRAGALTDVVNASPVQRALGSVRNAIAFQRLSGTPWSTMIREGLAMKRSRDLTWGQVLMAANAPMLYRAALLEGRTDVGIAASGQVAGVIDDLPSCRELLERIVTEATEALTRLGAHAPTTR